MESHIPCYMRSQLLYADMFQDGCGCKYVVLAKGPHLHEVWHQNIIASCNLTGSVLKASYSISLAQKDIELSRQFSYVGSTKTIHYVLKIGTNVVLISKCTSSGHLKISLEFPDVIQLQIVDDSDNPGQITLHLIGLDGSRQKVALVDVKTYMSKDSTIHSSIGRVFSSLNDQLMRAESELATVRLDNERNYMNLVNTLQFGRRGVRGDVIDEMAIVAKYGDIWIRMNNDRMVIGVPIFNSTFKRKRVVHNIRPALYCSTLPQLSFNTQMYHCRLDDSAAPSLDELLGLDDVELSAKMSFDHDWKPQTVLLPGMAAVLVLTTSPPPFIENAEHDFYLFVHYDLRMPNDTDGSNITIDTLQLNCGHRKVTTDILYSADYQLSFHSDTIFKDVLSVIATTQRKVVQLEFGSDGSASCLDELFVSQLRFVKIHGDRFSHDAQDTMDIDQYIDNLVDVVEEHQTSTTEKSIRLRPCDTFYQPNDGFFKGMLIRRFKHSSQICVLKIFCSSSLSSTRFVQMLRQQCGPDVSIISQDDESDGPSTSNERRRLVRLAASVRNEAQFLTDFARPNASVDDFMRGHALCELQTDLMTIQRSDSG